MNLINNENFGMNSEGCETGIAITIRESIVRQAYRAMDKAAACGLERLKREDGIVPTCKLGCSHCCGFHIIANIAEANTLAQYIRRELTTGQINELRVRTRKWHAWDNSRPGRYRSGKIDSQVDMSNYIHRCPLLVNGACIIYPVRPVVCRMHFVCSQPLLCLAANDPKSETEAPNVLTSILELTNPFSLEINNLIEEAGMDASQSIMLLPQWLAIQMDWDFAISP